MEATIEKPRTMFFGTMDRKKSVSTYALIMNQIEEQKRLVAAGIIEKPKPVNGFTAEDWKEYENGISIEDYARKKGIAL